MAEKAVNPSFAYLGVRIIQEKGGPVEKSREIICLSEELVKIGQGGTNESREMTLGRGLPNREFPA
jgi:hypothetical protein